MSGEKLSLIWIPPAEVSEADFEWLRRAEAAGDDFNKLDFALVSSLLFSSHMHLFRFNPVPGVLLIEVLESNGIKRLKLIRAAGRNVGWIFSQLADLLKRTARDWGCQSVVTDVYGTQRRLAEAMLRVGCTVESITLRLEA